MKKNQPKFELTTAEKLIRAMMKKHSTPFMLIRKSVLKKQFERFQKGLPGVTPFYAIKANPHPEIIKYMAKLGASFDVASANEMKEVLKLGVSPITSYFCKYHQIRG